MKNFTRNVLLVLLFCGFTSSAAFAQCTELAAGPWTDLGSGIAPCAENCGTPLEAGYQAWTNEGYIITEAAPGAEYTFSICDGYDSGVWEAELTATEYDGSGGAVDDTVFGTAVDCELTFVVPDTYAAPITLLIFVSDATDCGGASVETDNGFVTFTCGPAGGQPACPGDITCADGAGGETSGTVDICFGESTDVSVSGAAAPTEGTAGFVWIVSSDDISGSLTPNTEASFLGNFAVSPTAPSAAQVIAFANDGTQLPAGTYYFTPVCFGNATGDVSDLSTITFNADCTFTGQSFMVNFYADGDPACTGVEVACADGSAGAASGTNLACFGESTDLTIDGANVPTDGLAGFAWVITFVDAEGDIANVFTAESFVGNFPITGIAPSTPLAFLNDGSQLPAGTYYFTGIGFGNATDGVGEGALADFTFDPACTYVSNSIAVTFAEDGDPACVSDCPEFAISSDCSDGEYTMVFTISNVGVAPPIAITVDGTTEVVNAPGTVSFGPYPDGTTVSYEILAEGDGCTTSDSYTTVCGDPCEAITEGGIEDTGAAWTQASSNFGTPVCDASCGGTGGPNSGDFYVWFGGIGTAEEIGSMEQTITPQGNEGILEFYLWINAASGTGNDFIEVSIDGNQVFQAFDSDSSDYAAYTLVSVDVSDFITAGEPSQLVIGSSTFGPAVTNFFVDDITLSACLCPADAGTLQDPILNGSQVIVVSTGYQTVAGYSYFYVLTDGAPDYNIIAINEDGLFDLSEVSDGNYVIHGLSFQGSLDDLTALGASTGVEVLQLIELEAICADLHIDEDDVASVSITGINDNINGTPSFQIKSVYPSPTTDNLFLSFELATSQKVEFAIFDLTGKMVAQTTQTAAAGLNTETFDVSNFATGVYTVQMTNGKDQVNARFIKK